MAKRFRTVDSVGLAGARKIAVGKLGNISGVRSSSPSKNTIAFSQPNVSSSASSNISSGRHNEKKSAISQK